MDKLSPELKDQLLGAMLEMWQCPECGATSFTHKDQGALMIRCLEDHGGGEIKGTPYKRLVWMKKVRPTAGEEE
jgi:hypothetical protein